MKILFIGGTGVISYACSELCIKMGYDLYLLNRGISFRKTPVGAKIIRSDIRNYKKSLRLLNNHYFDVIVNWIAYDVEHVENDYKLFYEKTSQYIFISSASAYKKPIEKLPIKENYPLYNPFWEYSQKKIACEEYLLKQFREKKFPLTIVRPSHTYDMTKIPLHGGYTTIDRMKKGKKVIIHDDGKSLWTLTYHKDFAKGFCGLPGKSETIGQAYNITSDEYLSWNEICKIIAGAIDVSPEIVHIPSDYIIQYDKEWGDGLLGDKAHSKIFDNTKIKSVVPEYYASVPFSVGIKEIISWYNADKSRRIVDYEKNKLMDKIIDNYNSRL
ncbi:NAD-dependent epimerase/dehydratase family protein [Bacteroidota bacterium]